MVRNINKTPGGFSRAIQWIQPAGDKVLFNAYSSEEGNELWVSNGTRRGTKLLKDIQLGPQGALGQHAVSTAGLVYFGANDGIHGFELWRSDGTPSGTQIVADLAPGQDSGPALPRFAHRGIVYFGYETLWASDGSAKGCVELSLLSSESGARRFESARSFVAFGESTYFLAGDAEIWKSDGSGAGTTKVCELGTRLGGVIAIEMRAAGDCLFVVTGADGDGGGAVWAVTPSSKIAEKIGPQTGAAVWDFIFDIGMHGDLFFFTPARYGDSGDGFDESFWVSDGTSAGTRQLLAEGGVSPVSWGGWLYFASLSPDLTYRLWQTDGTTAGTNRVAEFGEGAFRLWPGGDHLYFEAVNPDGVTTCLWQADGTALGTKRVRQLDADSYSNPITLIGDSLYFADSTGTFDSTLFRASGKQGSAAQLTHNEKMDLSALDFPDPTTATTKGGQVYFTAVAGGAVHDIWRSNGTVTGTRRVWRAPTDEQNFVSILGSFGDHVLFMDGFQLCSISGKKDRSRVLMTGEGWDTSEMLDAGTLGFFTIRTHTSTQLWRSDGTPGGTYQLRTSSGASPSPEESSLTLLDGVLYFIEEKREPAAAIWRTDGTATGTWPVREFLPVDDHDSIVLRGLCKIGDGLAFLRWSAYDLGEVWTSDGSLQGTRAANPIVLRKRDKYSVPAISMDCISFSCGGSTPKPSNGGEAMARQRGPTSFTISPSLALVTLSKRWSWGASCSSSCLLPESMNCGRRRARQIRLPG